MINTAFVFLAPNYGQVEEHIGTASIASYLESKGMHAICKVIVYDQQSPDIDAIFKQLPSDMDLCGFPLFHTNARIVYKLIDRIKEEHPNCLTFSGGRLATDACDLILNDCPNMDFIILGDGEEPLYDVINCVSNGLDFSNMDSILAQGHDKKNKKPHVTSLHDKTWPSRQYLEQVIAAGCGTARISTTRICCANCAFCSFNSYNRVIGNKKWIGRDIEDVYNEVIYIYEKYNIRSFAFNDGSFEDPGELGKQRIRKFCELILSYPVKFHFWCFLRAETFHEKDRDLIQLMKKAGFTEVLIGIEAGNNDDLKVYNKIAKVEDNKRSINLFSEHKINVLFGFIMYNPFSTPDTLLQNYHFLTSVNSWRPHTYSSKLALYYETKLHRQCEEKNLLKKEFSYLEPTEYNFLNNTVAETWNFIEEYYLPTEIMKKYDYDLFYFNNFFYNALSAFPEEAGNYFERYDFHMKQIAKILSEFFKVVYLDQDLEAARKNIPKLENDMRSTCKSIDTFRFEMTMRKPFKNYLKELFRIKI